MARYTVRIPYCVWVSVEVTAEDEEAAEEAAFNEIGPGLIRFADGSVGTRSRNVTIEVCDAPLEMENIGIRVEA